MEQLLIFPFNGNAIEAVDCIAGQYELLGFIDDTPGKQGPTNWGVNVFDRSALTQYSNAKILAVPGSATSYKKRKEHIQSLGVSMERFVSLVHPGAYIG